MTYPRNGAARTDSRAGAMSDFGAIAAGRSWHVRLVYEIIPRRGVARSTHRADLVRVLLGARPATYHLTLVDA